MTGLEYSTSTVDITQVEEWARVDQGIADPVAANQVLTFTPEVTVGTPVAEFYSWKDAGDLNVGLNTTDSVTVTNLTLTPSGTTPAGGDLTVNGNTTLGDTATDIHLSGCNIQDSFPNYPLD